MSDLSWALLIIFGTVLVTLLAVIAGALVYTLAELRTTARVAREALERLAPRAEVALDNICEVSSAAARGTNAITQFVETLPFRPSRTPSSRPLWGLVAAGIAALFSAYRRRRAARRGAGNR